MNLRRSFTAATLTLALLMASAASWAFVTVGVSITVAPPVLPIYTQPPVPGPGFIWVPGYWAWGDEGYYWVPGTWVEPPSAGLLWTPGYWDWVDGAYLWNPGYWGPQVGFYGGVDYGFGYTGVGYAGGYWNHGAFFYNRSVNNLGHVHITNVYNRTVVNPITVNRISYHGGAGGLHAHATPADLAAAREQHIRPVPAQQQHEQTALREPQLRASFNHGRPPIAATPRAGAFRGQGVVTASASPEGAPTSGRGAQMTRPSGNGGRPATGRNPEAPGRPAFTNEANRSHPSQSPPREARPMESRPMAPRPNESRPARAEPRPSMSPPAMHAPQAAPVPMQRAPSSSLRYVPERRGGASPAPQQPHEAHPQSEPRGGAPHGDERHPNERQR